MMQNDNVIRYIAFDCETGGIDDCTSLLETYFIVLDEDFNELGHLQLLTKPNDGNYIVTGQGLGVNKINITEHDKAAITYSQAGTVLRDFLIKHSENGKVKLTPMGHNIAFDVKNVNTNLLSKKNWDMYCSYGTLDSGSIARTLQIRKKIPRSVHIGLGSLMAHFGIKFEGEAHTGQADIRGTIALIKRMLEEI